MLGASCSLSPSGGTNPLVNAAAAGDFRRARELLNAGHDVNEAESSCTQLSVRTALTLLRGDLGFWASFGGTEVEWLLDTTPLVDAQYLVALDKAGGVVPRCQEVPKAALITTHNVWRLRWHLASVLVLSWPWLDNNHPDREGEQLRRIAPILKVLLEKAKRAGGEYATVGVLVDYCCLPQLPHTEKMDESLDRRLDQIHAWYSHPFTNVLLMTAPLPAGHAYGNKDRPFDACGRCRMERRLAGLVKTPGHLLDFSEYQGASDLQKMCVRRPPPLSPTTFARELRASVMTYPVLDVVAEAAEVELAIEIYERGFVAAFETFRAHKFDARVHYTDHGWGKTELPTLLEVLKYAEEHVDAEKMGGRLVLELGGNAFDRQDRAALEATVVSSNHFEIEWKRPT